MMFESDSITVTLNSAQIAEICFDAPNSVNKLDLKTLQSLDQALDTIKNTKLNVKGLLLKSGKEHFIVGADIGEFLGLFALPESELNQWLKQANQIFCKLEDLTLPTASAITGFALGGGMETILSTDFRVADHSAIMGLPETKLGIMPGFGGTVRLPRVIGADNAIEWIASGKQYTAQEALSVGVIDAVTETECLIEVCLAMLEDASSGKLDWQARRRPKLNPLGLSNTEQHMCFNTAKAMVAVKAGPHYPAPVMAVETIAASCTCNREQALAKELAGFIRLAKSTQAQALVGLFLSDQKVKSIAKQAARHCLPVEQIAVLGAGIMGGGIAYQAATNGLSVSLKDIRTEALHIGLNEASKLLGQQVQRGKIDVPHLAQVLNRIVPTLDYSTLRNEEVVIEAVIENPKIKSQVLAEVESYVNDSCIITSNTSTISINQLAGALKDPSRFCGMHFFNPVHRMPLVEIIRGKHTSTQTIRAVVALATQMGKSSIVVNDCPGFFVNRVLFPYFRGFTLLVAEGVNFEHIDNIMEQEFGWPMGPAYLLDVVGLDTAHHAKQVLAQGFPERMASPSTDAIDILYQHKQFGQKTQQGFYQYHANHKGKLEKHSCQPTHQLLNTASSDTVSPEDIIARLMIPMVLETIRCLEEKIIASPEEADIALVYGLGFPPFRGGAFRYLETLGLPEFLRQADRFAHLGPSYLATSSLRKMAQLNHSYLCHSATQAGDKS